MYVYTSTPSLLPSPPPPPPPPPLAAIGAWVMLYYRTALQQYTLRLRGGVDLYITRQRGRYRRTRAFVEPGLSTRDRRTETHKAVRLGFHSIFYI